MIGRGCNDVMTCCAFRNGKRNKGRKGGAVHQNMGRAPKDCMLVKLGSPAVQLYSVRCTRKLERGSVIQTLKRHRAGT